MPKRKTPRVKKRSLKEPNPKGNPGVKAPWLEEWSELALPQKLRQDETVVRRFPIAPIVRFDHEGAESNKVSAVDKLQNDRLGARRKRAPSQLESILLRHVKTASDFNNREKIKILFDELDAGAVPLPRRRGVGLRTGKWSNTTASLRKRLIENLKRNWYRWQPAPATSELS